jgi:hypothetical protein
MWECTCKNFYFMWLVFSKKNFIAINTNHIKEKQYKVKTTIMFPCDYGLENRKENCPFLISRCPSLLKSNICTLVASTYVVYSLPIIISLSKEVLPNPYSLLTKGTISMTVNVTLISKDWLYSHLSFHLSLVFYAVLIEKDDHFILYCASSNLTKARQNPFVCTYLDLRKQDTSTFPLTSYHETNINIVQSILFDGLVAPGTVVSTRTHVCPSSSHFARDREYFDVSDFTDAIFLNPNVH